MPSRQIWKWFIEPSYDFGLYSHHKSKKKTKELICKVCFWFCWTSKWIQDVLYALPSCFAWKSTKKEKVAIWHMLFALSEIQKYRSLKLIWLMLWPQIKKRLREPSYGCGLYSLHQIFKKRAKIKMGYRYTTHLAFFLELEFKNKKFENCKRADAIRQLQKLTMSHWFTCLFDRVFVCVFVCLVVCLICCLCACRFVCLLVRLFV